VKDVQAYRPGPPPIGKGYASANAVCHAPDACVWRLKWSSDGRAVVLMRDGEPWAIASLDDRRGLSKAIQVEGPWGKPWSGEIYNAIHWEGQQ
jgi:hypothetical protein